MSDAGAARSVGTGAGVDWRAIVATVALAGLAALAVLHQAERTTAAQRAAAALEARQAAAVAAMFEDVQARLHGAPASGATLDALRARIVADFDDAPRLAARALQRLASLAAAGGDLRRAEAAQREAVRRLAAASDATRTPAAATPLVPEFAQATVELVRLVVARGATEDAAAIVSWGAGRLATRPAGRAGADEIELAFADALAAHGAHEQAAEAYRELAHAVAARGRADGVIAERARLGRAAALEAAGRAAEAEPIRREWLARIGGTRGADAAVDGGTRLVANLLAQGRAAEAEALAEELLVSVAAASVGPRVEAARVAGQAACALRRFGEGQRRLDAALADASRAWGPGSAQSAAVLGEVGRCLALEGRDAQALVVLGYAARIGNSGGVRESVERGSGGPGGVVYVP